VVSFNLSSWYPYSQLGEMYVHTNYESFYTNVASFGMGSVPLVKNLIALQKQRENEISALFSEVFGKGITIDVLVQFIKDNYKYYSELYKIDPRVYRNDISFSIAKHILDGFCQNLDISLPPILTVQSKDLIEKVRDDGTIIFLVDYFLNDSEYVLTSIKNQDIHIMNKQSILNHKDTLLELI
jgi:hypothetical protein